MRKTFVMVVVIAAACLLARTARAQSSSGAIQGRVIDAQTGQPMDGVTVVVSSPALQGTQAEVTDEAGFYLIANLPPGSYEIVFYFGEAQVRQQGVRVMLGATTPVNLRLDADATEHITVVQRAPSIDSGSGKQGVKMDHEWLDNVPQRGRSFEGTLGAAAGAQDDLFGTSFSGSTSVENNYVIDGVNTTGLTYGTVGSTLLTNFVEEIEVITGGYDAEFGRSTGGVVNVVTKSGGNAFRGSTWLNVTAGALQLAPESASVAGSAISADSALDYDLDFGFELGGPVVKDKVWFYVGFAPMLWKEQVTRKISTQVDRELNNHDYGADPDGDDDPATTTTIGCEQSGSCEADGLPDVNPKTGFSRFEEVDRRRFSVSSQAYQFTGKLTFAATSNHQGSLALTGAAGSGLDLLGVEGTPTAMHVESRSLVTDVSARWMSKFDNNRTELSAVFGWHRAESHTTPIASPAMTTPATEVHDTDLGSVGRNPDVRESDAALAFCTDDDPLVPDAFGTIQNCPLPSYRYSSPGMLGDRTEQRFAAKLSATKRFRLAGHHQVKLGFDGEDNRLDDARRWSGGQFNTGAGEAWEIMRFVRVTDGGADVCGLDPDTGEPKPCDYLDELPVSSRTLNWAAFIQDKWDVLPNLRFSVGLRYEQQTLRYGEEIQNTVDPITGEQLGENALDLSKLWAPRIGFIYDWTKEGRSKIYASYGRFYEAVPMDINNRAFGGETNYLLAYDWATQCGAAEPASDGTPRLPSNPANCPAQPSAANAPMWDALFGGSNTLIVPGLDAQRLDEVVIGVEYEPMTDVVVGLSYQNRTLGKVIEDLSVDGTETYIVANPGEFDEAAEDDLEAEIAGMTDGPQKEALQAQLDDFRKIREFDKPRRRYDAVTLSGRKRFSSNFLLQASYTYSRLEGNYPGLFSDNNGQLDPNITSQYDLIELLANRDGRLPADRPHIVKVSGFYRFDLDDAGGLTVGATVHAQSGKPIELLGSHAYYGAHEVFILPRGAGGRSPWVSQADVRLVWSRGLGQGMELSIYMDLLNLLDTSATTEVDQVYTTDNVNPIVGGTSEDLKYLKRQDSGGAETGEPVKKQVNWRNASSYQNPLTARFGMSLAF